MEELETVCSKILLLRNLPQADLQNLLVSTRVFSAPNGRFVACAGDSTDEILFVLEGGARFCRMSESGKEATLALLGPGAHIGLVSFLTNTPRATDVVATCRSSFLCLEAGGVQRELQRSSAVSNAFLRVVAERLREFLREFGDHLLETSLYDLPKRLTLRLFEMAEPVEVDGVERLLVRQRPSHQELARLLGVSREAVTRALNRLNGSGYIELSDDQVFVISTPP